MHKWAIVALFLLMPASVLPLTEPSSFAQSSKAAQFAEAIDSALARSDYVAARQLIDRALQVDPTWKDGLWKAGLMLYQQDQFQESVSYLERLTAVSPDSGAGWALRGMCDFELANYGYAVQHLERAQKAGIPTKDGLVYYALLDESLAYIQLRSYGNSISLLNRVAHLTHDPDLVGRVVHAFGLAALHYLPASELTPEQSEIVDAVGKARYQHAIGQQETARTEMEAVVLAHPGQPMLHYAFGALLVDQSENERAAEQFRMELQSAPENYPSLLALAFLGLHGDQPEAALPYAREAVRQNPDSHLARVYLGNLLVRTGDMKSACTQLEAARQLDPEDSAVHYALIQVYRKLGRSQDAQKEIAAYNALKASETSEPTP